MNKQTLGTMIASLRKEHGMTQAELAEKMGVTDKAVSKWERDLSCPDITSLPKLAETFAISVDELMQVKPPVKPGGDRLGFRNIFALVCRAVTLAMGVAVTVLSVLGEIDSHSGFVLLGTGLTCAGIALLQERDRRDDSENAQR